MASLLVIKRNTLRVPGTKMNEIDVLRNDSVLSCNNPK
jgi:hypothetical protein